MVRGEGKGISLHPCPFKEEECQDQLFLALVLARGIGLPEQTSPGSALMCRLGKVHGLFFQVLQLVRGRVSSRVLMTL